MYTTNTENKIAEFNHLYPRLKFTAEKLTNKLNYLHLTIINNKGKVEFNIYQKSTATDLIIPNNYKHSFKQKSDVNYLINCVNICAITSKKNEKNL